MIKLFRKKRAELLPEEEILKNRYVMGSAVAIGVSIFAFDATIVSTFAIYLAFNALLHIMQRRDLWAKEFRWTASIMLDVAMTLAVMFRAPEAMAFTYPVLLWMILGNGFRFGIKWLFVASGLATAAFGTIVYSSEYWQHNLPLGISLTVALLVIPAYCSTLIRKISQAKEEAETASRAKSYFLASVSHELRTPLNAIIGYGNHLRQQEMPQSHREMIDASVLAGEHLLALIEQLIQVAKAGTGANLIKNNVFRTTDILTEIRDIMAGRAEEKGLQLRLHAEPLTDMIVDGPRDTIRNVLLNLTGNAVKFTDSGSVAIGGGIEANGNGQGRQLWFTVSDTGIGIASAATERIFQPFQQADETVMNRFGGTGLGLSICKQIVEQAGGTIGVSSELGQGSTFRFTIPVKAVVEAEESEAVEAQSADLVRILSLGHFDNELLARAQSAGNFSVRHIDCKKIEDIRAAIASNDLSGFKVVMISQALVGALSADDPIWSAFTNACVAPVLVADVGQIDLQDVTLRAAFASIIPPSPDFDQLRSAIRIGASFAHRDKLDPAVAPAVAGAYTPRKILVADDNRTNRNVLAAILEAAGHSVEMATDGDEALDALEAGSFDVLLLDVNMPRLNGIDACRMWRQIEGGRTHLPVIGVTADATSETEQACVNAGMDLRLTKPVNSPLLLATIDRLCGGSAEAIALPYTIADPLNIVVPLQAGTELQEYSIDPAQIAYLQSIGDDRFLLGMIDGFFDDVEESIGPMRQSVENNDVKEFRFCAHAFKSSANNMGARKLAALCGKLEKITEAEFEQHGQIYLERIERELDRVSEELNSPDILIRPAASAAG